VLVVAWLLCASASFASESVGSAIALPLSPLPVGLDSLMPVPISNPVTEEKIELGRRLFFDQQLSRDGTVSCASCHHPDKAFTDGRVLPVGIDARQGRRNVPSLMNSAYATSQFWDGRSTTLEEQALIPLTSSAEMSNTLEKFHNIGVSWGKQPLDLGRYEFTGKEGDQGKFKTPSLRNLLLLDLRAFLASLSSVLPKPADPLTAVGD
jgi:cytochrome c peroxidase